MTRMWNVSPSLLCDRHLLGEHKEMHQVAGTILKHPHGRAIAKGHARKGQLDTSLIQERHDVLAGEMVRRGFLHSSPLAYTDTLGLGYTNERENLDDLQERCPDCRQRIVENGVLV